jgi:hypothetical protein
VEGEVLRRSLISSAVSTVPLAISLALFTQLFFVKTGSPQFIAVRTLDRLSSGYGSTSTPLGPISIA